MNDDRRSSIQTALLFVVVAMAVTTFYIKPITVDQFRDFMVHLSMAHEMAATNTITLPHFFFHSATTHLASWTGATLQTTAISLTAAAQGVTCLLLMWLFRYGAATLGLSRAAGPDLCALMGFALCFVGPLSLPTLPNLYIGYAAISCAHSPTMLLLRPFAVALFMVTLRLLLSDSWSQWARWALFAAVLAVVGGLTKPNYNMALAPALALLLALRGVRDRSVPRRSMATLGVLGLAVAAVSIWQLNFTFGEGAEARIAEARIAFAPLLVMNRWNQGSTLTTLAKLGMSLAFPLFVAVAYRKAKATATDAYLLSWLCLLAAIGSAYLLVETGAREGDGNFVWGLQICQLILMALSVAVFVSEEGWFHRDASAPVTWLTLTGTVLFALHFFSGLIYILFAPLVI